jgi:hypothetical protein
MIKFILWIASFIGQGQIQSTSVTLSAVTNVSTYVNGCTSFQVASNTGCSWMCDYCASIVGPNYYFTDGVCTYETGGCAGSPQVGVTYTCCTAA